MNNATAEKQKSEQHPAWLRQLSPQDYTKLQHANDIWKLELTADIEVDGVPCKEGTAVTGTSDGISSGTLGSAWTFREVTFPEGTKFTVDRPRPVWEFKLDDVLEVYDNWFAKVRKVRFPYLWENHTSKLLLLVGLLTGGAIMRRLAYATTAIPNLYTGDFTPIPYDCQVVVAEESPGIDFDFRPGDRVWLDQQGRVARLYLGQYRSIQGIMFHSGFLFFDRDQNLRQCNLQYSQKIQGVPCKEDEPIEFHPNGQLRKTVLSDKLDLEGESYSEGTTLLFSSTGKLQQVVLGEQKKLPSGD